MDTVHTLMTMFLEEKISAARFKEAMFTHYYESGLFTTLDPETREKMDVLMLTINMYEEDEQIDDGLIHITESGLRKHVRNEWPEFFLTDAPGVS